MQLRLLFYTDVNFVFYECQGIDKNDKDFQVGRLVAPSFDKYIGLGLT